MVQPLFYLFKTINSCYLFDSNRNNIYPISPDAYQILFNLKDGDITLEDAQNSSQEISELIKNGLLSVKHVKKIEHVYTPFAEHFLARRLQKVTLQLTQNCNFRCAYCHYTCNDGSQRTHSSKRMSVEVAKAAILYLRDHSVDTQSVYIGFYGGEPFLEFSLLKEVVAFCEDQLRGKDIHFTVTSNGTLLTDDVIEFLAAHKFVLLVSLDGPREIHNRSRIFSGGKGSFDVVIDVLRNIYDKYPDYFKTISINMVLNPSEDFDKINSLFSDYNFLKKLNVSSTIIDDIGATEKNVFSESHVEKERYHVFLKYLSLANRFPSKKCSPIYMNYVGSIKKNLEELSERQSFLDVCAPGGPCVPGESRLMVTVDGDFIPCERVSEIADPMIIGNVRDGINMEKVRTLLNIAQSTSESCKNCWAFLHCHLCAKYSEKDGALSSEMRLNYCEDSRKGAENKLRQYALIREMNKYYNSSVII